MIKHPSNACVPTRVVFCLTVSGIVKPKQTHQYLLLLNDGIKEFLVCFTFKLYYYMHLLEGIMWFHNVQMIGNRGRKGRFLSVLDDVC